MLNLGQNQNPIPPQRLLLAKFLSHPASVQEPLELASVAVNEGLLVYYLAKLRGQGIDVQKQPSLMPLLIHERQDLLQTMLQDNALQTIDEALKVAGIRAIWLKGAAFAHTIYPEPGFRTKVDIDLIVGESDYPQALTILQNMAYRMIVPKYLGGDIIERLSPHAQLIHEKYPSVFVELHHRLLGYEEQPSPQRLASWLSQAIPFQIADTTALALKPEHQFLFHCAHGFLQHGESMLGLRDYLDFHLLIHHYLLDWNSIIEEAVELKWTYIVEQALRRSQSYFDTPLPANIIERLIALRPEDEKIEEVILRATNDMRRELVLQVMQHLKASEALRLIWAIAFPSQDYMRERYQIAEVKSVLPYYPYRWFYQSLYLLNAMFRRLSLSIKSRFRKTPEQGSIE